MKGGISSILIGDFSISFIPGICSKNGVNKAFIQIITKDTSYCIFYNPDDFKHSSSPFFVRIGANFFSKETIILDIDDEEQGIKIHGSLHYKDINELNKTKLSPNIMGPFSHIPFMECNHAILSMKHEVSREIIYK